MSKIVIERKKHFVEIEAPTLYVDHESKKRSGHMSHAMAEPAPDQIIAFNSNCTAIRSKGRSAFGWVECRIFEDAGKIHTHFAGKPLKRRSEFYSNSLLLFGLLRDYFRYSS